MALDLYTIPLTRIDGSVGSMGDFRGKVLLIVNVASKCGLTPQYEGLESVQQRYAAQGFDVLGFPANDFAGQEPGSDVEIQQFCTGNFGASFPMFSKVQVTGPEKHPLYAELIDRLPTSAGTEGKATLHRNLVAYGVTPNAEPELMWNFEKFLVGRDGTVVARFSPDTLPQDPAVVAAVEAELAKSQ